MPAALLRGTAGLVVGLGVVSLLTDLSTDMMRTVLPFFVASIGGSAAALGVIVGVSEAVSYLLRAASGRIADRTRWYWGLTFLGYALSNLAKPAIGLAKAWPVVAVLASVDRFGKALRTPGRDAILSFAARGGSVGRVFGLHRFLDQLGATAAPLVAVALYALLGLTYSEVILATAVPGLAALLTLYIVYRSFGRLAVTGREREVPVGWRAAVGGRLKGLLAAVFAYGAGTVNVLFVIMLAGLYVHSWKAMLLMSAVQLAHAVSGLYAGRLYDRVGEPTLLLGPSLMTALALLMSIGGWPALAAAAVLLGVQEGVYEVASRSAVGRLAPRELRGTAYGAYHAVYGVSVMVAGVAVGALLERGPQVAAAYVVTVQLLSAALLLRWLRALRISKSAPH